jgi:hypothetical protein
VVFPLVWRPDGARVEEVLAGSGALCWLEWDPARILESGLDASQDRPDEGIGRTLAEVVWTGEQGGVADISVELHAACTGLMLSW